MGKSTGKMNIITTIVLKEVVIHSDGCLNMRYCMFTTKKLQKIRSLEKDHKFFQKAFKNTTLTKKKVAYRNKIF